MKIKIEFYFLRINYFIIFVIFISSFLISCNTVVGTTKGVGRDIKATYIYTRDAFSGDPVSDSSD